MHARLVTGSLAEPLPQLGSREFWETSYIAPGQPFDSCLESLSDTACELSQGGMSLGRPAQKDSHVTRTSRCARSLDQDRGIDPEPGSPTGIQSSRHGKGDWISQPDI
jgi:hypothetical protein